MLSQTTRFHTPNAGRPYYILLLFLDLHCTSMLCHKMELSFVSHKKLYSLKRTAVRQLQLFRNNCMLTLAHLTFTKCLTGGWVDDTPHVCGCFGEANCSCCVTLSQTTALDKEKQVFRRRRHQDVKLTRHLPHSIGAGASHGANFGLSPAEFTSESEDYSPSSADTVRSPTSPF